MAEMIIARTRNVVKANEIIQKSRFDLSIQQQKIILFMLSRLNPFDKDFNLCEFSVKDFCSVCGLDYTSGTYYSEIKKAIKTIADKSMWLEIEEGKEILLRWFNKAEINANSGNIKIELHEDMKPFLLQLKSNFLSYELIFVLKFKSKRSIRLYEWLKSLHYREIEEYTTKIYSLDEIRKRLGAEGYTTWQHLKDRVLTIAIDEINKYSDKTISYELEKKGKKIIGLKFNIKTKDIAERNELYYSISEDLGFNQMILEGYEE